MRITINDQGQLSLPPNVLERLNVAAGGEVEVEVQDGAVILKPVEITSPLTMEGSVLVYCGEVIEGHTIE
jgi:AbrB family looped-hinge helix DNA binding protein